MRRQLLVSASILSTPTGKTTPCVCEHLIDAYGKDNSLYTVERQLLVYRKKATPCLPWKDNSLSTMEREMNL